MKKSPVQFSLAALMLTVAVVAGDLALMLYVQPEAARLVLVLTIVAMSAFGLIGVLHGRPALHAFCVGALVPLGIMLIFLAVNLEGLLRLSLDSLSGTETTASGEGEAWSLLALSDHRISRLFGIGILTSVALGYLCVGFRWLIERRED